MTGALHRTGLAVISAVLFVQVTMAGVGNGQVAGQLTNVGGNKTNPTCSVKTSEIGLNALGPPTDGIASNVLRDSPGIKGIAADLRGGLYLAYGGYILGRQSIVAGKPPDPKGQVPPPDEEAPALETLFPNVVGIAVPPTGGTSLWVLQEAPPGAQSPQPGVIRHIQLGGSSPVTTWARTGSRPTGITADGAGNVYVSEATGAVYKVGPSGKTPLATIPGGANGITVDANGHEVFVSGSDSVYRLSGSSVEVVAGPAVKHTDDSSPAIHPAGLAIGHEIDAQGVRARYLYIADQGNQTVGRVVRVDLSTTPRVVTTVAGGGSEFIKDSTLDAKKAQINARHLAADTSGVYITSSDQCTVFYLRTPPAVRIPADVGTPPGGSTNNTLPPDSGRTSNNDNPAPDPAPSTNSNTQVDPGTSGQPAGQGNQTQIVPGNQTQVQPQPQTELRVIDQGNVVTTPEQAAQPTVEPVPTPGPAAQFTATPAPAPTPAPTPTPAATPTPADVGTAVAPDPGPTSAVVADAAPVVPAAPAVSPVPPAPALAPPPAAPEPVSNSGLVHGDSGAPARGATRYAMVRNDDDQSVPALALAGAGAVMAVFLCLLFVAPGASSKPKPRPKGAY